VSIKKFWKTVKQRRRQAENTCLNGWLIELISMPGYATVKYPNVYLAVLYTAIGAALFFSSPHYYPHVWVLANSSAANTK
jgi:hypothetical protein